MRKKTKVIENFDRSSQTYFQEINKFKPLSRDEEYSLWERYKQNNDISARNKIIESNLKFVASVAKSYQGNGLSYSDLIAEGNTGLLEAMKRFDYKSGNKTISYSVWWIKQAILEALSVRNGLSGEELPNEFENQGEDADCFTMRDEFIVDDGENNLFNEERLNVISQLMGCLTDREAQIIKMHFGMGEYEETTLGEIGKAIGLTKERVRQIKEKALRKLRAEALNNSITSDIYK